MLLNILCLLPQQFTGELCHFYNTSNASLDGNAMTVRLSLVKGKQASQFALVRYERWNNLPSPIDLWVRWKYARVNHSRFFGLEGQQEYNPNGGGGLTRSLQNFLDVLQITAPPGGKFTSHSLCIGALQSRFYWVYHWRCGSLDSDGALEVTRWPRHILTSRSE